MDMDNMFDKFNDDYLNFKEVESKLSQRPDLHAFILLDSLFPKEGDIVCSASHDEIWLNVDLEDIEKLTEKQILELVRCGVRFNEDGLCMFV